MQVRHATKDKTNFKSVILKKTMAASFNVSTEDIKNVYSCTVCFNVPRKGYIYQCDNGHLHCSTCHEKLKKKKCPICRIKLRETRNLAAEQTIEKYVSLFIYK